MSATLYLYRVCYTDGHAESSSTVWGCDRDDAIDRWLEAGLDGDGLQVVSCKRVPNVPAAVPYIPFHH